MTKKIYRTAQGKMVDLGSLQLQNENVRAVGNMSVNARGDLIDSNNRPITTRNEQVAKQYRKQTTNVVDKSVTKKSVGSQPPVSEFDQDFGLDINKEDETISDKSTGLAAAIARARQIKQEPLIQKNNDTIRKI